MKHLIPALLVMGLAGRLCAQMAVEEVGPQLQFVRMMMEDILQIRMMTQNFLVPAATNISHHVADRIDPNIQRLRDIAEGQNNAAAAMAKRIMLENFSTVLQQHPAGTATAPAAGKIYDGSAVTGGGEGEIDSLMGMTGLPVALERQLPSQLIPLSASDGQMFGSYLSHRSSLSQQLLQMLTQFLPAPMRNMGSTLASAASSLGNNMVGDGIFLRPYMGQADDAYVYSYGSGDPMMQMAYWATVGQGYDPLLGSVSQEESFSGALNNALTQGAAAAVATYLRQSGQPAEANPYATFSQDMAGYAVQTARVTSPGQRINLSNEQVEEFEQGQAPPLDVNPAAAPPLVFPTNSLLAGAPEPYPLLPASSAAGGGQMLTVTVPQSMAAAYNTAITANDGRLRQIMQRKDRVDGLMGHLRKEIEALQQLLTEADKLRTEIGQLDEGATVSGSGSSGASGSKPAPPSYAPNRKLLEAIPQVTQAVRELQEAISTRQDRIVALEREAEGLNAASYAALKDRSELVSTVTAAMDSSADKRAAAAAYQASLAHRTPSL